MSLEASRLCLQSPPFKHVAVHGSRASSAAISLEDARLRATIEWCVAGAFGMPPASLAIATRGRAGVALARQVAMYLSHVACGETLTDVGRIFARDRTTVAHACAVVEDRRDDPRFDLVLDLLEQIVLTLRHDRHSPLPAIV